MLTQKKNMRVGSQQALYYSGRKMDRSRHEGVEMSTGGHHLRVPKFNVTVKDVELGAMEPIDGWSIARRRMLAARNETTKYCGSRDRYCMMSE